MQNDSRLRSLRFFRRPLKGLAHADLAKILFFCMDFYCFIVDYYVALIPALVLLKSGNLRITVVV